jgi:uncharacterized membrane protein (DUF4010 family)
LDNLDIDSSYFIALGVSLCIGLIIGLEREFDSGGKTHSVAGIRTFSMVSILGFLVSALSRETGPWLLAAAFAGLVFLIGIAYYMSSAKGSIGITTEFAMLVTFCLGAMTGYKLFHEALAAAVVTTTLLSLKGPFTRIIGKFTEQEIFAFVKFFLLTIMLFPFLPNRDFGPGGIFNPRDIGLVIVIVSALDLAGYLLIKFIGADKGVIIASFFGGMISSTAVSWVYAGRSKTGDAAHEHSHAAGIAIASAVMFFRVALVTFLFNQQVFYHVVVPCVIMGTIQLAGAWMMVRKQDKARAEEQDKLDLGNPLNVWNAVKFGMLYVAISAVVFYTDKFLGDGGLILSGLISGLADVDAITIRMAKLGMEESKLQIAGTVIVVAMLSNTIVKMCIAIARGSRRVKKYSAMCMGTAVVAGLVYLLAANTIL